MLHFSSLYLCSFAVFRCWVVRPLLFWRLSNIKRIRNNILIWGVGEQEWWIGLCTDLALKWNVKSFLAAKNREKLSVDSPGDDPDSSKQNASIYIYNNIITCQTALRDLLIWFTLRCASFSNSSIGLSSLCGWSSICSLFGGVTTCTSSTYSSGVLSIVSLLHVSLEAVLGIWQISCLAVEEPGLARAVVDVDGAAWASDVTWTSRLAGTMGGAGTICTAGTARMFEAPGTGPWSAIQIGLTLKHAVTTWIGLLFLHLPLPTPTPPRGEFKQHRVSTGQESYGSRWFGSSTPIM